MFNKPTQSGKNPQHNRSTNGAIQLRVLVFLPQQPETTLTTLGLIGAWKAAMPEVEFDALCVQPIKPLARHCKSLRLVISYIESDQPFKRDLQQGNQLYAFGYKCAMALTTNLHPQLMLRFAKVRWRMGWKRPGHRLLLSNAFTAGDWQGLWQAFSPDLPFPSTPPIPQLGGDTAESHSAMLWRGLNKNKTILVITDQPLAAVWSKALQQARQHGTSVLACGSQATTSGKENKPSWCDAVLDSPYQHEALAIMPSVRLLVGMAPAHQCLAAAFGVDYADSDHDQPSAIRLTYEHSQ